MSFSPFRSKLNEMDEWIMVEYTPSTDPSIKAHHYMSIITYTTAMLSTGLEAS